MFYLSSNSPLLLIILLPVLSTLMIQQIPSVGWKQWSSSAATGKQPYTYTATGQHIYTDWSHKQITLT